MITGGGISVNGEKVSDELAELSEANFEDGAIMIKKGKKVFHKVVIAK